MTSTGTEPEAPAPAASNVALRVTDVAKAFGPTHALRTASFEIRQGEIHALVGENGSGKSTMVKVLAGVHAPDRGTIEFGDRVVQSLPSPKAAQSAGIVTVFQEVLVAGAVTVLENLWLGFDSPVRARVSAADKRRRAKQVLEELGQSLDLDEAMEQYSLSERQATCIARALMRQPKLLILDEATSALDVDTRNRLFEVVQRLAGTGVGILLITHRMDEINEVADRVTVMRDGTTVATLAKGEWTTRNLVRLMTGEEQSVREQRAAREGSADQQILIETKGLKLGPDREPIDIQVRAGEFVGVAGLDGHGQEAFLHALRGAGGFAGEVIRYVDGQPTEVKSVAQAAKLRIAYVPRERSQASFAWMSIRENFGLPTLEADATAGVFLRPGSTKDRLAKYRKRLGIVLGKPEDRITTLSGGNQQKVIIARWLAFGPQVFLLNDPTRGIDVGAKRDLYELLTGLADEGIAVVMISTEVDELLELMDRVLVFREHELFREIDQESLSREALVAAFFGEPEGGE